MTDSAIARDDFASRVLSPPVARVRPEPPVRTGVVEPAVMAAAASAVTVLGWGTWPVVLLPLLACAAFLVQQTALPSYERGSSFRPLSRSVIMVGVALLGLAAAGVVSTTELRGTLAAVAAVLGAPFAVRVVRHVLPVPRSTLLVGDRIAVSHLIAQWGSRPEVRLDGICLTEPDDDAENEPTQIAGVPVVGRLDDVARLAQERGLAQVVVAPGPVLTAYDVRRLSWALEDSDVELAVAAEVHGAVPRRIEPRLLGRRLLLSVRPSRRPVLAVLAKSALDRLLGVVLLVVFAPLLVGLMLLVRWDTPGPGIFRQIRAGRGGHPFTMYKLRTMTIDAEHRLRDLEEHNEGAGPLFKMTHDPRVTRIGRMLRRTSLDELPQLVNVVRGTMSLIGPRPALPHETDAYDAWISRRLSVKPGMTGLWQISGRSSLSWNQAVRLDLDYVDNWTLGGDLSIAGRTVNAVLRREGL